MDSTECFRKIELFICYFCKPQQNISNQKETEITKGKVSLIYYRSFDLKLAAKEQITTVFGVHQAAQIAKKNF